MEEKNSMTVTEVLEGTIRALQEITFPAKLIDQVGRPIAACVYNLQQCVEAIRKAEEGGGQG